MSLMKRQFVVTHTLRQTEIPALLDSWVTNTHCVKMLQLLLLLLLLSLFFSYALVLVY
jgi:hypothetical protein